MPHEHLHRNIVLGSLVAIVCQISLHLLELLTEKESNVAFSDAERRSHLREIANDTNSGHALGYLH
jgi:hypothetical protein